jgi:hypothetical protein
VRSGRQLPTVAVDRIMALMGLGTAGQS